MSQTSRVKLRQASLLTGVVNLGSLVFGDTECEEAPMPDTERQIAPKENGPARARPEPQLRPITMSQPGRETNQPGSSD